MITESVREQVVKYLARARSARNGNPTMTRIPVHLQANELAALQEFVEHLLQQGDGRVVGIWLFGSKARGDFESDSDLDLLIVLEDPDWVVRDGVHLLAARVSLEHDVLINTHLLGRADWDRMARQHATLWRQVRREGFPLRLGAPSTHRLNSPLDTARQPIGPSP